MTEEQIKKLRGHYHSLLGQQRVIDHLQRQVNDPFNGPPATIVEGAPVHTLSREIKKIEREFPGLLPPFRRSTFQKYGADFLSDGVLPYLAGAIGILQVEIEMSEGAPVT